MRQISCLENCRLTQSCPAPAELADFLDLNLKHSHIGHTSCANSKGSCMPSRDAGLLFPGTSAKNTFMEKEGGIIEMGMIAVL